MRLFRLDENDSFVEYREQDFKGTHREQTLEDWLEANSGGVLGYEGLLIIGRQVATNFRSFIDLLAIDHEGNCVVIELKRDRTPRETLAQALEYASFAASLDFEQLESILCGYTGDERLSLAEYHRSYFSLTEENAVSFNKDQRIVLVGQDITPEIRQTSGFLCQKGLHVTCLEFKYFETELSQRMLSVDVVVGQESIRKRSVSTGSLPKITKTTFLESCDQNGYPLFEMLLSSAENYGFPIHWGSKGFSMNVNVEGIHIAVCFCYPPGCVYNQSIYTGFTYIERKLENVEDMISQFYRELEVTGLFVSAGSEYKCIIDRQLGTDQITKIHDLFVNLALQVIERAEK
jgi:hypothetical protein